MPDPLRGRMWANSANPGKVPMPGYQAQSWRALEPSTQSQRDLIDRLLVWCDADPALLLGNGYDSVAALSSWAASWAIDELRIARDRIEQLEQVQKDRVTSYVSARSGVRPVEPRETGNVRRLVARPVLRCASCGEDRPMRDTSGTGQFFACLSCGTVRDLAEA